MDEVKLDDNTAPVALPEESKALVKPDPIMNAHWHSTGCVCGEYHAENSKDYLYNRKRGKQEGGHRKGCWCGEWHLVGQSGNPAGGGALKGAGSTTRKLRKFEATLDRLLDEKVGELGETRREVMLAKFLDVLMDAMEQGDVKLDALIRGFSFIALYTDGKPREPVDGGNTTNLKVVQVNQAIQAPKLKQKVELKPAFIEGEVVEDKK